jgi:beta-galactosidase/beta-glucuronidase
MVRDRWENLNGLWRYAITPLVRTGDAAAGAPASWQGNILVPFPVESDLSGVKKAVQPDQQLWYRRTFSVPEAWKGQRVLLHFGAVDWQTTVWVNGRKVGVHQGGYDPFTFDITGALTGAASQQLTVAVWDPSDSGFQPRGKQCLSPHGIWYTASTGIWQTVWLEPVPAVAIGSLKMVPDIDAATLHLRVNGTGSGAGYTVKATAFDRGKKVAEVQGTLDASLALPVKRMQLWSPAHPFLYDLTVSLYRDGRKVDEVKSYFGMRKVALGKDARGVTRLFLNNRPLFMYGPLDQGFWPDGLYTAPTDEALKSDIEKTRQWGFNMIRMHVKVEPERWYYWCDKLGLLVWQDMPSGDARIRRKDPDINRVAQSARDYTEELSRMIRTHFNHPCIVTWVLFNEGWGQFQTAEISALARKLDPTRLQDATTGWADRGVGDMHDMHKYPGPDMYPPEAGRASVLGEFGGQALVVKDHLWLTDFSKAPRHYKTSQSETALHERYAAMADSLAGLRKKGLSAAVYTQTTDVEIEVNGIMTYDRKVMKFDQDRFRALNEKVIGEH